MNAVLYLVTQNVSQENIIKLNVILHGF